MNSNKELLKRNPKDLMTKKDWEKLNYFGLDSIDNFGDPFKMDKIFMFYLDEFREFIGHPIYVTSGYRSTNYNSTHYRGYAVDCYCKNIDIISFYIAASRFPWIKGIGIYTWWKPFPGLHIDMRSNYIRNLWISIKKKEYIPFTPNNLYTILIENIEENIDEHNL